MDEINKFLESLYHVNDRVPMGRNEFKIQSQQGISKVLVARILSTKFRKSKPEENTVKFVENYIENTVANGRPIRFLFLFGGYKQARLSSAPFPEWAEIFNINFALTLASYIESIYKPGVEIIYRGDEVILTYLDNYKVSSREIYKEKFNEMLETFRKNLSPERNIFLEYQLTKETSPLEKLIPLMEELYPKYLKKFEEIDPQQQEDKIMKSYRNICWDGEENLTQLTEQEKREKAKKAYIMHDAFLEADVRLAGEYFDNGISVTFRRGVPLCLHYGACSSSSVQFWAGEGYINKKQSRLIPWILSFEQQKDVEYEEIEVNEGQSITLGLKKIKVLNDF